ncbi:hypothetical protein [Leptolyngbya sp. FACHB-16]|uniref:hypothetical protein n=1 Tax=unclassified Leptolyngbya TaxID=2650499 RepID=UPI001682B725|nr:hypothetical protein [Leptolyngbya sp. FACHB-16]MBD2156262.1 hypothetical protein [Leptolyngbya sp. FACHB-16]
MTHDDLQPQLEAIESEVEEQEWDKVSGLVTLIQTLTSEELNELMQRVREIQLNRSEQQEQPIAVNPLSPDEIRTIIENIRHSFKA